MSDDAEEAIKRDNWEILPPKSSLARMHSSLLISPTLLHRQHTLYEEQNIYNFSSPHSLHKMDSNASDGTPITIVKGDHIKSDWYHLTMQKISPLSSLNANTLERQQTIVDSELQETTKMIHNARKLRNKWLYKNHRNNGHVGALLADDEMDKDIIKVQNKKYMHENMYLFKIIDGIVQIYATDTSNTDPHKSDILIENEYFSAHSFDEYLTDLESLHKLMSFGPAKTLSYTRLKMLQRRFQLHLLLNRDVELTEISSVPYRDFYNVRKIDNNIHLSAGMNQKHLLEFMRDTYRKDENKVVTSDNKTLSQVFEELNININYLSVDKLDVHAQTSNTFQRFDLFDAKYNPVGQKTLRTLFLKINNAVHGKYLADMIKNVIHKLEKSQYVEYRLTVRGHNKLRWNIIADWVYTHELYSKNVRWIIQIPRIYTTLKKTNLIHSFHDMIVNIFEPLFEVTLNPNCDPKLHIFLQRMVGIDVVGDESIASKMRLTNYPSPKQWNNNMEPPYMYYLYYIYTNIYKLNKLREKLGFNTFGLRPQAGEAGSVNHLASAFLLSHSINHGIRLYYSPILQYLYYLEQIGISISPLSNSILFKQYDENPFPRFFQRGLNISLSTDNPLLIHYTKDPLLEEYSIAAQVYGLTSIDLCEIARNSVIQCGWDRNTKQRWIGTNYYEKGFSNDIYRTNVPDARIQFRYFLLKEEREFIKSFGNTILSKAKHFNNESIPYFNAYDFEMKSIHESDEENHENIFNLPSKLKTIDNENNKCDDISDTIFKSNNICVNTPFGDGFILENNGTYCIVQLEFMICCILKSEYNVILEEKQKRGKISKFRDVLESDMKELCQLKENSKEILCFRYIFNREYLKVFTLNNQIIGFVSGIKKNNNLCIDMVIIHIEYRRKGYGTQMMKRYINNIFDRIKNIELCCQKNLIVFFESIGFKLIGKCQINKHQNKLCYQMSVNV